LATIDEVTSSSATSLDFLIQNFPIINTLIATYILAVFFIFIFYIFDLSQDQLSLNRIKNFIINFIFLINTPKKMKQSIIFLCYTISSFVLMNVITNLIKTEKLVVDTSEIIYSETQLERSKKIGKSIFHTCNLNFIIYFLYKKFY
jgi:hypothetical protein